LSESDNPVVPILSSFGAGTLLLDDSIFARTARTIIAAMINKNVMTSLEFSEDAELRAIRNARVDRAGSVGGGA
jgi:hypothetical protein